MYKRGCNRHKKFFFFFIKKCWLILHLKLVFEMPLLAYQKNPQFVNKYENHVEQDFT